MRRRSCFCRSASYGSGGGAGAAPNEGLGAALAAVIFAVCLAPWAWRNWAVFHARIPIRGNLGAESGRTTGRRITGFREESRFSRRPNCRVTPGWARSLMCANANSGRSLHRGDPERFFGLRWSGILLLGEPAAAAGRETLLPGDTARVDIHGVLSVTGWLGYPWRFGGGFPARGYLPPHLC